MADAKIINYGQQISAGSTAIPDNTSEALDIESTDAKDYITIDTTDGSEDITIKGGGDSLVSVYDKGVTMTGKGGTTGGSPNDLEDVVLYVENSSANSAGASVIEINSDGNNSGLWFSESDTLKGYVGTIGGHLYVNTNSAAGDLIFRGNSTERMRIDADTGATKITGPLSTVGLVATALTGTFTATNNDTAISSGSSTAFTTELHVGAAIKIGSEGTYTVAAIASDTALTLDSVFTGSTGASKSGTTDSGELFAVKTGDSQTLFSVEPSRFLFESSNYNVVLGSNTAGEDLTTGDNNLFVGRNVGQNVTTGQWNTLIGNSSADGFGIIDPDRSVVVGAQAGRSCGDDNVYVGTSAGQSVIAGQNVGIGSSAMTVSGAERSVGIGYAAHKFCTGSDNVAVGHSALTAAGDADNCVALGTNALVAATGNGNIGLGKNAGNSVVAGSSNICIGGDSDVGTSTFSNTIAIGGDAVTTKSTQAMIGNTSNLEIIGLSTTAGTTLGSLTHPFGAVMLGARRIYSTRRSCGRVNSTNTGKIDQLAAFGGVSAVLLPAYSIITFCSVTIDDPSGASTHAAMLATSTATGTADDAALTGTVVEVIGSGASGTRSTATTGSATNIALNAVKGQTWYNDTKFHVGSAPVYVYLASAGTSNSGTAGDTFAYITVEYIGAT